jgi:metal-responsive CopG/Arc/MetJ family transcriptional regulator
MLSVIDTSPRLLVVFIHTIERSAIMATAVKKTISLPPDLANEAETLAKEEGKTLSAVIQDALRLARQERTKKEFREMQGYWSKKAKDKGILTEKDLERYLRK